MEQVKEQATQQPPFAEELTEAAPREIDTIKKEALGLWAQAGELQYTIEQNKRLLSRVNDRLEFLCSEANERAAMEERKAAAQKENEAKQAKEKIQKAATKKARKAESNQ